MTRCNLVFDTGLHPFGVLSLDCHCQRSLLLPPPSALWRRPWLAFSPSASLCLFIMPILHQWLFQRGARVRCKESFWIIPRNATADFWLEKKCWHLFPLQKFVVLFHTSVQSQNTLWQVKHEAFKYTAVTCRAGFYFQTITLTQLWYSYTYLK